MPLLVLQLDVNLGLTSAPMIFLQNSRSLWLYFKPSMAGHAEDKEVTFARIILGEGESSAFTS